MLHTHLHSASKLRASLLDETMAFDTAPDPLPISPDKTPDIVRNIQNAAKDFLNAHDIRSFDIQQAVHPKHRSSCHIQRILTRPTRTASQIADLLMAWLPRYLQHAVSLNEISRDRQIFRISRIPLLEIEKLESSPDYCRLIIQSPWGQTMKERVMLTIMRTGNDGCHAKAFAVIENTPNLPFHIKVFHIMLKSFSHYLQDYGCGSASE